MPDGLRRLAEMPRRISRAVSRDDGRVEVGERARPRQVDGDVGDDAARSRRHDDDPVGDEDRLGDAVGDQHDRRGGALPEPQQLEVEALAAQRVERAERLVEQQDLGLEREGAGERDPLARAAGQLGRAVADDPGIERDEVDRARRGAAARRSGGQPASSSGYVMLSAAVRHGSSRGSWKTRPIRGSGPLTGVAVERDRPRSGASSPAMTRSSVDLPQPFGPDEGDDPATGDVEVDAVEDRQATAVARRERQVDPVDADRAAGRSSAVDAAAARRRRGRVEQRPQDRRGRRVERGVGLERRS